MCCVWGAVCVGQPGVYTVSCYMMHPVHDVLKTYRVTTKLQKQSGLYYIATAKCRVADGVNGQDSL